MRKLSALVVIALVVSFVSPVHAAKKVTPKMKTAAKVPTQLPAYKGKTKVAVDFQQQTESTVVLVSEPIAKDRLEAKDLREDSKKVESTVAKASPTPAPTASPTPPPVATTLPQKNIQQKSIDFKVPKAADEVRKMEAYEIETATPTTLSVAIPTVSEKIDAVPTPEPGVAAQPTATRSDFEDRSGSPVESTTQLTSRTSIETAQAHGRTFFFETGFIDSRYDKLQADLKNGASVMSISIGIPNDKYEIRASLDVAHGLDQAVTPQNTRMLAARGGMFLPVGRIGRMNLSAGGTAGLAGIDVRSYRDVTSSGFTIKQHAMGTTLALVPEVNARVEIGSQVLAQLAVRYWVFAGQAELAKLSGLSAVAGIGYNF